MKERWINLPAGAQYRGTNGHFYKKYAGGWLCWDTYHRSWRHSDTIVQFAAEVEEA